MSTDCRTRPNAFSTKSSSHRRKGSTASFTGGDPDDSPIRIFEHYRVPPAQAREDELLHKTDVRCPATFGDVEEWLREQVNTALAATGDEPDQTSAIKLLFLDEKKCNRVFGEAFPMNRLQPILKI